jgi:long-subunit fatty acid transport protein
MKTKFFLALPLAALLCFAQIASAQLAGVDFNTLGGGARARGMGGAFMGVADDVTAVFWNPAGISQIKESEFTIEFKNSFNKWTLKESNQESKFDHSYSLINFVSFAYPFKFSDKNSAFAVAYQRLADLYSLEENQSYRYESRGGLDAITTALGINLNPQISLGLSVNFILNGMDQTLLDKANSSWEENNTSFSGVNFNLGTIYHYRDRLNLGLILKTPFDLTQREKITGAYGISLPEGKGRISVPLIFGIGSSFEATENLTLALDFESKRYSQSEQVKPSWLYHQNLSLADQADTTYNLGWKDCNQIRLGVEYLWYTDLGTIPLRAGYRNEPRVYADAGGSQVVGNVFCLGSGLVLDKISFDLAYEVTLAEIDGGDSTSLDESKNNLFFSTKVWF